MQISGLHNIMHLRLHDVQSSQGTSKEYILQQMALWPKAEQVFHCFNARGFGSCCLRNQSLAAVLP